MCLALFGDFDFDLGQASNQCRKNDFHSRVMGSRFGEPPISLKRHYIRIAHTRMRFDEISFKSSIHFWISENSNAVKNDRVEEDCSLHHSSRCQLLANACMAASRVGS